MKSPKLVNGVVAVMSSSRVSPRLEGSFDILQGLLSAERMAAEPLFGVVAFPNPLAPNLRAIIKALSSPLNDCD